MQVDQCILLGSGIYRIEAFQVLAAEGFRESPEYLHTLHVFKVWFYIRYVSGAGVITPAASQSQYVGSSHWSPGRLFCPESNPLVQLDIGP